MRGLEFDRKQADEFTHSPDAILKFRDALNQFYEVTGYICIKDFSSIEPPEHLPKEIEAAFKEGAACHAIKCYNAAACMFRLCLDLLSKPLLPDPALENEKRPTNFERRNLGPRLTWLFNASLLPSDLAKLASSVKDDGNDGAHVGNLTEADCDDLIDFTTVLLERFFTEPKKVELAEARRAARRKGS